NAEVFSFLSGYFGLRPTSPAKGLPVDRNPELGVPAVSHLFRQSPKLRVPAEILGLFRMRNVNADL
ncbi:hypothetical protein, partial [Vibrio hepatarius]